MHAVTRGFVLAGVLTVAGIVRAEPTLDPGLARAVDAFVAAEMARERVPGLAVAIVRGRDVLLRKGYGLANVELDVPVGPETMFQSGSVGKQFTATAVMLEVEAGKLRLDESITQIFPDAPADWKPITVRHLLTHTSGIPDYTDGGGALAFDPRHDHTEAELVRLAYAAPLDFAPGTRWRYSNTGYLLLGAAVRAASGQFYGDVLRDRVFAPLGMRTARIISEEDIVPHRAAGYRLVDGALKNQEWVAPSLNTTADGSLYLSLDDLIAWDRGLRQGAILRPDSWQAAYTPVRLASGQAYPYGFGWFIGSWRGQPWLHHSGSWQGFKTYISRYLAADLTVIVLANLEQAHPSRFVDGVIAIVEPGAPRIEPRTAIPDDAPAVTARVRALLHAVAAGTVSDADRASLGPGFSAQLNDFRKELAPLGSASLTLVARTREGDEWVSRYLATYPDREIRVSVGILPDGRLTQLSVTGD